MTGINRGFGSQVLATKLNVPTDFGRSMVRSALMDRLAQGRRLPLTLMSAPAGFGKTVLASQWAVSMPESAAWVSLDSRDNDLGSFLAHVVEAIRMVSPDSLPRTVEMGSIEGVSTTAVARSLLNELDRFATSLVVFLDDYHSISAPDVHEVITELTDHPADDVHLVICTRHDPPLALARLRGSGRLNEIRAVDLQFSDEDAKAFIEHFLERPVDDTTVRLMVEHTEGWPAGLRLVLEAARHRPLDEVPLRGAAPLDATYTQDYLVAEVLDRQQPAIVERLMAASVLDRFCAALSDALAIDAASNVAEPAVTGEQFLDWLVKADLFVVPLDRDGRWFRFHHLFQDMLRRQLAKRHGAERETQLRQLAADWFRANGLSDEAIELALTADDLSPATAMVVERGRELIDEGRFRIVRRWIGGLPRHLVDADPELLVLEAWVEREMAGDMQHVLGLLDRAETALADHPLGAERRAEVEGTIAALYGMVAFVLGDLTEAIELTERAIGLLTRAPHRYQGFALVVHGIALQANGQIGEAIALTETMRRDERFRSSRWPAANWTRQYIDWAQLDLPALYRHGRALQADGERGEMVGVAALGDYAMGVAHYGRNELDAAADRFTAVLAHPYEIRSEVFLHSCFGLALAHFERGWLAEAEDVAELSATYAWRMELNDDVPLVEALEAELSLRQGRIGRAMSWADRFDPFPSRRTYMFYHPVATFVKVLLADGSEAAGQRADNVLAARIEFSERTHERPVLVQLLGLQAIRCTARGDDDRARASLARAVELTTPGGAVRLLADLGPGLAGPLARLDVHGEQLAHVAAVLAAIKASASDQTSTVPAAAVVGVIDLGDGSILTKREAEILGLLAERYSNKEIARDLYISAATVKKHTIHIYEKLHVGGRREAVAKAIGLGYISEV